MALVLLPLVNAIGDLGPVVQFIFFGSLMFVFTHISSASPFLDNIEGQVYFKKEYLLKKSLLKFQLEMVMYAVFFSLIMTVCISFFR
ncbi:hypothetical protein H1D32_20855 [Anaerobacillus sp. CMMVII]|uniref:hypothetical protein n=1 Tax=Anaerobacillus sp. CMMVII TaxID=2755588 RepID=UPI0021B79740|nr:hypothetical protein [Anaerobacillus sp. CMMVII]MCT8139931.1 hypothetical protein [Anaerobacillus sp. CMMVII]